MLPPPPPPPPPPAIEEKPSNQPTFMEHWLEKNASPPINRSKQLREYLGKQCLFPTHIPYAIMCDVKPMHSLIANHISKESDGDDDSDSATDVNIDQNIPTHRSPLDDMRKIASLCASYKTRSIVNYNEFQHKRSIQLIEQQREQQSTTEDDTDSSSENIANPPNKAAITSMPTPPPYHPEYTQLSLRQNAHLSKIHSANYNLCLANAVCPDRMRRLVSCWKGLDPRLVKMMKDEGIEAMICLEEKEAVERCVGLGVQRVMKDILG